MELKIEQLLNFCTYYTLAKNATTLPHSTSPPQTISIQSSSSRSPRPKKVQYVESKKVKKPKMEHVPTTNKQKPSTSSQFQKHNIQQGKNNLRQVNETQKNKNFDINFFVSHLASEASQPNKWKQSYQNKQYEKGSLYSNKYQSNLQNYQTFGKSAGKPIQFETFQQKMKRQGRSNLTQRQQRDRYDRPQYMVSQFVTRPQQKQSQITQNNLWMGATQKAFKSQFINIQGKSNNAPTFQNLSYMQTQSKISYSPVQRQFTPTRSNISTTKYSPDSHLSKSRTKHQRKKSQKPFYDASKLSIKKQSQSLVRQNVFETNNLSQSFVTVDQNPNTRRINVEDGKRQTSTTAPPLRNNRQMKQLYRIDRNETDLDDALGQTLTQLSHRKAPISIDLKIKNDS